ncbi:MAG: S8 family serine peptidase [Prevotella sp.]|nr:S8 family serine peptidase [Prevotella sp.]
MKDRRLLFLLLLFIPLVLMAEGEKRKRFPGGRCYLFRLTLADKQGSPFDIAHPEAFLSQRSLERRRRQGLSVDSTDLPISPVYRQLVEAEGVEIVSQSKWQNTLLVRSKRMETLKSLQKLPFVVEGVKVWTSPDSIIQRRPRAHYKTDMTLLDTLSEHHEGAGYEQLHMLGGDELHRSGFRGRGIHIAVLDGGFMNADVIPSLKKTRLQGAADFVYPRCEDIFKETDHGTMVLSTMAANEPTLFVGTAPEASYWLLRTEETETETPAEEDYWTAAVEFADSAGVDIISSSLGYHDFNEEVMNYRYRELDGRSSFISRSASMLAQKGMVLVNSAGNDGMGTWKKINVPADAFDILTVGAVSSDMQNAAFSSIGPTADGRVKPDIMALGSPTTVITGRGMLSKNIGTSFSTPIVAGLVACLWQALPQKTAYEIIDIVRRCGNNADYPDNVFGYGIPDFWKAYSDAQE